MCQERYDGGDPYTEADRLQDLARRIMWVQKRLQNRNHTAHPLRAFHAKMRLGVENAKLVVRDDVPAELRVGFVRPGAEYPATVRLSNASGSVQPDYKRDFRGIGLRVRAGDAETHDFLLTNGPVSHARNGTEFIKFAEALAGSRLKLPFRLLFCLGPFTALRMLRTVLKYSRAGIGSLADETYWSRGALKWGPTLCGRLKLAPPTTASRASPDPTQRHSPIISAPISPTASAPAMWCSTSCSRNSLTKGRRPSRTRRSCGRSRCRHSFRSRDW